MSKITVDSVKNITKEVGVGCWSCLAAAVTLIVCSAVVLTSSIALVAMAGIYGLFEGFKLLYHALDNYES